MEVSVDAHEYSSPLSLQDMVGLHSLLRGRQGGPRVLRQRLKREQRGEESLSGGSAQNQCVLHIALSFALGTMTLAIPGGGCFTSQES